MSLPYLHLPATLAVNRTISQRPDIHFVLHHHDLTWEGPMAERFRTPYPKIETLAHEVMLPDRPNTSHIVINTIAAQELWLRKGIRATAIPDGFNFERTVPPIDEQQFRRDCGFGENDLLIGMMTRVRINKAIETAIQFTKAMMDARKLLEQAPDGIGLKKLLFNKNSRMILVLTQSKDLDTDYFNQLTAVAKKTGVDLRFIGDRVVPDAVYHGEPGKYPFYGTYSPMDVIIYPPVHEGFGNQAIEAAWARKILVMREYPVAKADIWNYVPHLISLGDSSSVFIDGAMLRQAVGETIQALTDHETERQWTEMNYRAFKQLCDIQSVSDRYCQIYRRQLN